MFPPPSGASDSWRDSLPNGFCFMEGFGASRGASERGARGITDDLTGRGESPRGLNRVGKTPETGKPSRPPIFDGYKKRDDPFFFWEGGRKRTWMVMRGRVAAFVGFVGVVWMYTG